MNTYCINARLGRMAVAMCIGLLAFCNSIASPTTSTTQVEVERIQEQLRALDKEQAILTAKIEAQNNRLSDLSLAATQQGNHLAAASNQTTMLGNHISLTGMAITVLVAAAGLITYFSATARAKAEANQAAQAWFEENATRLTKKIADLETKAENATQAIVAHEDRVARTATAASAHIQSNSDSITAAAATLLRPHDKSGNNATDQAAADQVAQISEDLKLKPESSFSSSDHFTRGLAFFNSENYTGALQSFQAAASDQQSEDADQARYMFAQGVALNRLGRQKEAIVVYDRLVQHFGDKSSPGVREQVARALFNKGVDVATLHGPEQAIVVYDALVQRFGDDSSPGVREQVAAALTQKTKLVT